MSTSDTSDTTMKYKNVRLKEATYKELVKHGDLTDSFDSTISRLIRTAKKEASE